VIPKAFAVNISIFAGRNFADGVPQVVLADELGAQLSDCNWLVADGGMPSGQEARAIVIAAAIYLPRLANTEKLNYTPDRDSSLSHLKTTYHKYLEVSCRPVRREG
jgi:hypothetical protein